MNRISPTLAGRDASETLRIVFVGHADHGKSTLLARLLHDTGSLPICGVGALEEMAKRGGTDIEWPSLLDAFQAERDQATTIDTTQIRFRSERRSYVTIDAPDHREFPKNMVTGAASADAAVLVIDAREGVRDQTRYHAYLLHLMGVRRIVVVINKMDLVDCARPRFEAVKRDAAAYLGELGIVPACFIPAIARDGANVAGRDDRLSWHEGPTVVEALDRFERPPAPGDLPLRLSVQDVHESDEKRIVVGRVESGVLRVGDRLLFSPSNATARVASIETRPETRGPVGAHAEDTVGFTLDEPIVVERGEVASHRDAPPFLSDVFRARLFWFDRRPLEAGRQYKIKLATAETPVQVQSVDKVIDTGTLSTLATDRVERHGAAEVTLRSPRPLALDDFESIPRMGRFVLVEDDVVVGGGIVSTEGYPDQRALLTVRATNITPIAHRVSRRERETVIGHQSGVLWFTGLSAAGKSTLALALEQALFRKGYQAYALDGDNIRSGLNANLGFSPQDRVENIRRVAEVAALFADAGFIVITAFISPYRADRYHARDVVGDRFHEVYLKADLAVCEKRDPKGLYKKARRGEISDFTGVSAPYEAPTEPELMLETDRTSVEACLEQLVDYVERNFLRR